MNRESQLFCFLYHSEIAPEANLTCVADIIATARRFNKKHSLTGMLIFDGKRFCQYLEGPEQALQLLINSIAKDKRHVKFTPQCHSPFEGERRFSNWAMAYVLVDDDEPLSAIEGLQGSAALDKLQSLLPILDID